MAKINLDELLLFSSKIYLFSILIINYFIFMSNWSYLFVFRPLKTIIRLTYVIRQVINLVKLTNLG